MTMIILLLVSLGEWYKPIRYTFMKGMTSFVKMPLDYKKDGDQADGVRMYEER